VFKVNKFYITSAIPYVNASPHQGHILEFIQTDAISRYHELLGEEVFLGTGSDENSLKNVQAAEAEGITTAKLCERNAQAFKKVMERIGMSFSDFLRSSASKDHIVGTHELWKRCEKTGDIYKKKYKGLYCVGCEAFYTEDELEKGLCPEHKKKPEVIEEENYFFKLSKYQARLEEMIEHDELKVVPKTRKNEVLSFIKQGLKDFSISRSKERAKGWGIPVPGDSSQYVYVWYDALNIYQTVVGFGKDKKSYEKWWPADTHVIGKGILRFHAVYWPAILLSAGLKIPKSLFVHGYITVEGQKMSKSLGNVLDPNVLIDKYGADSLRYFMLRDISPFDDGDFSERALVERVNTELVSNYSNLFYRVTSFIKKNFDGKVPLGKVGPQEKTVDGVFVERTEEIKKLMEEFRFNEALDRVMSLAAELNKYFQSKKPWEESAKSQDALHFAYNKLRDVSILLYPFIPFASKKALKALNTDLNINLLGTFESEIKIKSKKLFTNVEHKPTKVDNSNNKKEKIEVKDSMIPFKEFQKLDIRTGTIKEVKDHPEADKLYVLTVSVGKEKRQIVAGVKPFYKPDELKGKQITVIMNLEPAEIRGVTSEGMLLAAGDEAAILSPIKKTKDGEKVR
jgi:methionyl-tRNA synthetase